MYNKDIFDKYLDSYKRYLTSYGWKQVKYKWQAAYSFDHRFDNNAYDLAGNLKTAIDYDGDLIFSGGTVRIEGKEVQTIPNQSTHHIGK